MCSRMSGKACKTRCRVGAGFGVQEREMESLTCKWWLEASFCKQVLCAAGEVGAVAVVFLQTPLCLDQGDQVM